MRGVRAVWLGFALLVAGFRAQAQGTFQNLNFEAANVNGYSPGDNNVPIFLAFPGWSGYYSNSQSGLRPASVVWYDGYSLGGSIISIGDTNDPSYIPMQGQYQAWLFGGADGTVALSQSGLVPIGTMSLLVDIQNYGSPFQVTLAGQLLNMIPLQSFGQYTLYGADISAFANQTAALSFISPQPVGVPPNFFLFDNIIFSTDAIPEPSSFALGILGVAGWFSLRNIRTQTKLSREQGIHTRVG